MKSLTLVLVAGTLTSIYLQMKMVEGQEKSCKSIMGDLTKRQLTGIAGCAKTMKFKNGKDKAKKMNCILKCVMIKEGLLNPEGYFSSDSVDVLLIREFPPSLVEKANATFTPCIALAKIMEPDTEKDEFCKTYEPAIKCLMAALPSLCA